MTTTANFTQRLLQDAGVVPGMRVLDIGCGGGDVSLLVAELTGDSGTVLGIDADQHAITAARARTELHRRSNVSFIHGELSERIPLLGEFDAVVGRRILMYLPDPTEVIRRIAQAVRPGGVFAFQESDSTLVPGRTVSMQLHDRVVDWIWRTVECEGADIHMGFHLPQVMQDAGLIVDHVRAEPIIQGRGTHHPLHLVIRAMLPRMIKHGVASEAEIDMETLERRLVAERPAGAVYVSDMAFGVWGHKPEGGVHANC